MIAVVIIILVNSLLSIAGQTFKVTYCTAPYSVVGNQIELWLTSLTTRCCVAHVRMGVKLPAMTKGGKSQSLPIFMQNCNTLCVFIQQWDGNNVSQGDYDFITEFGVGQKSWRNALVWVRDCVHLPLHCLWDVVCTWSAGTNPCWWCDMLHYAAIRLKSHLGRCFGGWSWFHEEISFSIFPRQTFRDRHVINHCFLLMLCLPCGTWSSATVLLQRTARLC